jgi:hypothetical protein
MDLGDLTGPGGAGGYGRKEMGNLRGEEWTGQGDWEPKLKKSFIKMTQRDSVMRLVCLLFFKTTRS